MPVATQETVHFALGQGFLHGSVKDGQAVLMQDLVSLNIQGPVCIRGNGSQGFVGFEGKDPSAFTQGVVPFGGYDPDAGVL